MQMTILKKVFWRMKMNAIKFSVSGGNQEFSIDISDLTNGAYFYSIMSGDRIVGKGKFTIVR